jgi:DNA-binding NarL/FixJ family response regulator
VPRRGAKWIAIVSRPTVEAVESRIARLPLSISIEYDGLARGMRLNDEVEIAVYFVVCESLIAATVSSAPELVEAVDPPRPQAVLTDIRMPPGHQTEGIQAAHSIRASHPGVGVVLLSQHADETDAFQLLQYGTAGLAYLLEERLADLDDLLHALREVIAGRSVIDPEVVDLLDARRAHIADSSIARLSPRERDVLRLDSPEFLEHLRSIDARSYSWPRWNLTPWSSAHSARMP